MIPGVGLKQWKNNLNVVIQGFPYYFRLKKKTVIVHKPSVETYLKAPSVWEEQKERHEQ